MDIKKAAWEASYAREENFIYYPKEEVIRFLARTVGKQQEGSTPKKRALDLGCGIGRQTVLLAEYGLDAFGADISQTALAKARALARSLGHPLDDQFVELSGNTLPFPDAHFHLAIVDSVLDSMEFAFARAYLKELDRTVTKWAYLNLISAVGAPANDTLVQTAHEAGTIQSYYDRARIDELIAGTDFAVQRLYTVTHEDLLTGHRHQRYNLILEKK